MSHVFVLQPNLTLLNKYGYVNLSEEQLLKGSGHKEYIEVDAIWQQEERIKVENGFRTLVEEYHISEHYDTLLYICLVESNNADLQYQHLHNKYSQKKRHVELAKLLLLYNPSNKHKPNTLKVSSLIDGIKLTDPILIEWIGSTIQKAIEGLDFNPSELGSELMGFIADDAGAVGHALNYSRIEAFAEQTFRKPGIRNRNSLLATFLLNILKILNNETNLAAREGIRFSDAQLIFLFEVSILFGWMGRFDFKSEPKDYMYILLDSRI